MGWPCTCTCIRLATINTMVLRNYKHEVCTVTNCNLDYIFTCMYCIEYCPPYSCRVPLKTYGFLAFLTVATMGLSNTSLGYLNYPTQVHMCMSDACTCSYNAESII